MPNKYEPFGTFNVFQISLKVSDLGKSTGNPRVFQSYPHLYPPLIQPLDEGRVADLSVDSETDLLLFVGNSVSGRHYNELCLF